MGDPWFFSAFSDKSSDKIVNLFQEIFPDSRVANDFHVDRKKIRHVVNYGLTHYFKGMLEKIIESNVSYDESLNDKNKKTEMCVLVRYWDKKDKEVTVRFWDAKFLGHATASEMNIL